MYGGRGDDTYRVDDRDDRVSEERGQGTDTVETTLTSYSLGRDLENLEYTGTRDFHGKGNDADNAIAGGSGNDRLEGRDGDDVITGGAGNDRMWGGDDSDTFVFAQGFGNDRIYDFDADPRRGQDMLDVSELGITAGDLRGPGRHRRDLRRHRHHHRRGLHHPARRQRPRQQRHHPGRLYPLEVAGRAYKARAPYRCRC